MGNSGARNSKGIQNERRLVLAGKSGTGKSATGNTILQKHVFKSQLSQASITKQCRRGKASYQVAKKEGSLLVVDTPGFFDTQMDKDTNQKEIAKCIGISSPGPHAILFVVSLASRFTDEEEQTVEEFCCLFGEEIYKFLIVVFTHGDNLKREDSVEETLSNAPPSLRKLLDICGNRYVVLDNRTNDRTKKKTQLKGLFSVIENMIADNGGTFHNAGIYKQSEEIILERIEEMKKGTTVNSYQLREKLRNEIENDGDILTKIRSVLINFMKDMITHAMDASGFSRLINGLADLIGVPH